MELLAQLSTTTITARQLSEIIVGSMPTKDILGNDVVRCEIIQSLSRIELDSMFSGMTWESVVAEHRRLSRAQSIKKLMESLRVTTESGEEVLTREFVREVQPEYGLREYQSQVAADAVDLLTGSPSGRVVVHMPTGAGKTRTAMHIISRTLLATRGRRVVVWLAHSEELCEQAAEEFETAWSRIGDTPVPVVRLFGERTAAIPEVSCGFVVASIQLMVTRLTRNQSEILNLARSTSLIVFDEAHQSIAPMYRHVIELMTTGNAAKLLGLTATPGRSTIVADQDVELAEFFHGRKVSIAADDGSDPIAFLQSLGVLAQIVYERLPYRPSNLTLRPSEIAALENSLELPSRVINELSLDSARNLLVLDHVARSLKDGRKCLLFACSVAHSEVLSQTLQMRGFTAGSVTSKTPRERRNSLISTFRTTREPMVICNYGVLTTGFDVPTVDHVIVTRPTQSLVLYSQMVGRAIRGPAVGGTERAIVTTVVDELPGFRDVSESFAYWNKVWSEVRRGERDV